MHRWCRLLQSACLPQQYSSDAFRPNLPPATRCTLCWIKKYTSGIKVPKKAPPKYFLYLIAFAFGGLSAMQPVVQGMVRTMYEIIKISCQSWSSVDVMYVHPPQVNVRKTPEMAIAFGRVRPGFAVNRYHKPTRAKRGPGGVKLLANAPAHGARDGGVAQPYLR